MNTSEDIVGRHGRPVTWPRIDHDLSRHPSPISDDRPEVLLPCTLTKGSIAASKVYEIRFCGRGIWSWGIDEDLNLTTNMEVAEIIRRGLLMKIPIGIDYRLRFERIPHHTPPKQYTDSFLIDHGDLCRPSSPSSTPSPWSAKPGIVGASSARP